MLSNPAEYNSTMELAKAVRERLDWLLPAECYHSVIPSHDGLQETVFISVTHTELDTIVDWRLSDQDIDSNVEDIAGLIARQIAGRVIYVVLACKFPHNHQ